MTLAETISMQEPLRLKLMGAEVLIGYDEDCWKIKVVGPAATWSPPYDTFREALQATIDEATAPREPFAGKTIDGWLS